MRHLISILLALTIFSCVDVHAQSVRRIYVSKDGNDKNSGTIEKPLGTIHKGIDQVKRLKNTKFKGPIELILDGGTYYLDKRIELDQTLSGTNEAPFIIRAAEGEKVVLSGGH